ncbi:MAG: hypothetical protein EBT18_11645 [Gammaproteobacteria bacterium]|nr:hypothetical protein [Gammaproteobacteria bacterium]
MWPVGPIRGCHGCRTPLQCPRGSTDSPDNLHRTIS